MSLFPNLQFDFVEWTSVDESDVRICRDGFRTCRSGEAEPLQDSSEEEEQLILGKTLERKIEETVYLSCKFHKVTSKILSLLFKNSVL